MTSKISVGIHSTVGWASSLSFVNVLLSICSRTLSVGDPFLCMWGLRVDMRSGQHKSQRRWLEEMMVFYSDTHALFFHKIQETISR